ncbi:MAG: DinB family protein, partial [Bryobacteraceae bacterium]
MTVSAATLRTHLRYTAWASRRLIEAASGLNDEELTRDFHTADHSVLGTLVHVYAADRVWLGRIQGNPPARFLDPDTDMKRSVVENDWPALHER